MWKIDSDGNAFNTETGQTLFVAVTVLKQERGCGGRRRWVGDFKSETDAREFIKTYTARLNSGVNQNDRKPVGENSD